LDKSTSYLLEDDTSIYYFRILFGTYGKDSLTLYNEMRGGDDNDIWNMYQTNRLHVSTYSCVLDNVGSQFARLADCFGPSNGQFPKADADILLLRNDETNLEDSFLQGRRVRDQLNLDLCKSWLDICTGTHGESCALVPLHGFSGGLIRLIDVERRMVVSAISTCSYAALSYRWGEGVGQLELKQATYERLTNPSGLNDEWDDIPYTIKDAMTLCCRLSIPFLWVDALCIIQDDPEDKHKRIHAMDTIYSGAAFTIVAASGSDSWAGLPGVRSNTRLAQDKEVVGSLTLSTAQPSLYSCLQDSSWNTRAWTFQEGILSKRLLIFTKRGTFFKCNTALWWEDTYQELPSYNANVIHKVKTPITHIPFWKYVLPSNPDFSSYAELVQDYTCRSMTKDTDSLNAFSGISRALENPFNTSFFQALPLIFFDIALCFEIPFLEDAKRRNGFPSWSWCGWDVEGGVEYTGFSESGEEDKMIVVLCKTFYRILHDSEMNKKITPIGAESIYGESLCMKRFKTTDQRPTISNTVLDSMSTVEYENLLIFEAWTTPVFVSAEDDAKYEYILRGVPSKLLSDKYSGTARLNSSGHSYKECFYWIEICELYSGTVYILLVEKDNRGISRRIEIRNIATKEWMKTRQIIETIYLL
jgi:hypothetical protein